MAAIRKCLPGLLVALGLFLLIGSAMVEAAATTARMSAERWQEVQSLLKRLNKPPLATIKSPDGDTIDCVHISKQPAFDHPLLKKHTIQMQPSYHPRSVNQNLNITSHSINQTWHQNGNCPKNTIPIRRTTAADVLRASSISMYGKKRPRSFPYLNSTNGPESPSVSSGHQYGVGAAQDSSAYGTKAGFNLWNPTLARANDFSLSQLWVAAGSYDNNDLNTIEVGWQVYPAMYGDHNTRLFIYWTRDAYQHTGCYNLACSGFVQTNNQVAIAGALSPMSTYGGTQYDMDITVWKDPGSGNWWLQVDSTDVGYWPSSIFTTLQNRATSVEWGGEVFSQDAGQTSTQMGSGHFPNEGFGKACHIKNLLLVDSSNTFRKPSGVNLIAGQSNCYNVQSFTSDDANWGTYIYHGGPGKNPNCP